MTPLVDTYNKVDKAVRFLNSLAAYHWELAYSGGKDSDVLLWLVRQTNLPYEVVHKCTTIDPPGTLAHVESVGGAILRPRDSFFHLVERRGFPTMFKRFCCEVLKEYYHAPYVLTGVRACESVKRTARYKEPIQCRVYSKSKRAQFSMPLLSFTDDDIFNIVTHEAIPLHPLYYDADGSFDVSRRLGCIGCPLQSDRGRSDFRQYPKFFRRYVHSFVKYALDHGKLYDPYEVLVKHLFYSNNALAKYEQSYHGLFSAPDSKSILENYFNITL